MSEITRREFATKILGSLTSLALVDTLTSLGTFAAVAHQPATRLQKELEEIAQQLRKKQTTPIEWQSQIERKMISADLPDLLSYLDFDHLERALTLPNSGTAFKRFAFGPEGEELSYTTQIFGMKKGCAIVPHGHHNLVSAHTVIGGELHLRNFERLRDEDSHMILEPTVDRTISLRDCSSQSSRHNNVHWFTAVTPTAYTFDVIVDTLDPQRQSGRDFVDVNNAEKLGNGMLRARIIDWQEAIRMYGSDIHH
jgi:hypothetical protein